MSYILLHKFVSLFPLSFFCNLREVIFIKTASAMIISITSYWFFLYLSFSPPAINGEISDKALSPTDTDITVELLIFLETNFLSRAFTPRTFFTIIVSFNFNFKITLYFPYWFNSFIILSKTSINTTSKPTVIKSCPIKSRPIFPVPKMTTLFFLLICSSYYLYCFIKLSNISIAVSIIISPDPGISLEFIAS